MGIALAAVIIHAMTPTHAHWGNRQYPPIAERLTAMIGGYNRPLDIIAYSNQEMVEALLDRLR